jgi:hypothetical protein
MITIEHADKQKIQAMYDLVAHDIDAHFEPGDVEMAELDKRWQNHISGKSKTISLAGSMANIQKHREGRNKDAI